MKIAAGTVVQLKSGSREMTVSRVIGESDDFKIKMLDEVIMEGGYEKGDLLCIWEEKGKFVEKAFKVATLIEVEDDEFFG